MSVVFAVTFCPNSFLIVFNFLSFLMLWFDFCTKTVVLSFVKIVVNLLFYLYIVTDLMAKVSVRSKSVLFIFRIHIADVF